VHSVGGIHYKGNPLVGFLGVVGDGSPRVKGEVWGDGFVDGHLGSPAVLYSRISFRSSTMSQAFRSSLGSRWFPFSSCSIIFRVVIVF